MRTRRWAVAVVSLGLALVAAGPAGAKPKGKLKAATFELRIEGEQLTTWKYAKQVAPSCDWPEAASGRQYIEFTTYASGDSARPKVEVRPAPGGGVRLKLLRDHVTLQADADLQRSEDRLFSQQSACPNPGSSGGSGGPGPDVHQTAHCKAMGDLDLYLGDSLEEVENPSYPTDLALQKPPRAPLFFAADAYWLGSDASDHNLPSACDASGMPYADIGITESQGEWAGALVPVAGSLPATKLLGGKKRTVVHLGRSVSYPNSLQTSPGAERTTGRTRIDLTLTFRRLP